MLTVFWLQPQPHCGMPVESSTRRCFCVVWAMVRMMSGAVPYYVVEVLAAFAMHITVAVLAPVVTKRQTITTHQ